MADLGLGFLSKDSKGLSADIKLIAQTSPFGAYIQQSLVPLIGGWKK